MKTNVLGLKKIRDEVYKYKDWILITIGAFLIAVATNLFFAPHNLVTGGISGIGIIVKYFWNIPIWMTTLSLNVPLFLIMFFLKGKKFGIKSLYGMFFLTFSLYITQNYNIDLSETLLICIVGGAISGFGAGLVFSGLGTTGGSDIIAIILQHFFKRFSVTSLLRSVETFIVLLGTVFYGIENTLYAVISIYIATKVSSVIVEGLKFGKAIYIISDNYESIGNAIITTIKRGVTVVDVMGMYSKTNKKMIICLIRQKQLPMIKQIIQLADKNAFVYITDAKEILGNGFRVSSINDI